MTEKAKLKMVFSLFLYLAFIILLVLYLLTLNNKKVFAQSQDSFRFISWGDAQDSGSRLPTTSNQAAVLNPKFTIFNGDFESHGFTLSGSQIQVNALNGGSTNNGLFNKSFIVRGNHDNQLANPDAWSAYHNNSAKLSITGANNYTELEPDRTYSFDYGNSRFIGVDVPGNANLLTSNQISFIDQRLTDAESRNLTHAFIYWHGPLYCVSSHCSCSLATDASCTPSGFINLINKHPIISATFHGHEHVFTWTHLSHTRLSGLNREIEQFITSPSGSGSFYTANLITSRYDFAERTNSQGFAVVDVNAASFTVSFYRVGNTSPLWAKTFTKNGPTIPPVSITPTDTPPPGGSTVLSMSVFLHGIGKGGDNVLPTALGNMNPLRTNRNFTIILTGTNNNTNQAQGTLQFNQTSGDFKGNLTLPSTVTSGTYLIKVLSDGYLSRQYTDIQPITQGQTKTLTAIYLITGDSDKDNRLNIQDYNLILDCFSDLGPARNCTDPLKKQLTDLTDDGSVNQFDYNLFLRELSVQPGQ